MPRHNGTGPLSNGPGAGWGLGPCGAGMSQRRGFSRGTGRGLGWRRFWGYYPSPALTKKEEIEILSEEAAALEEELKAIKSHLIELKRQK